MKIKLSKNICIYLLCAITPISAQPRKNSLYGSLLANKHKEPCIITCQKTNCTSNSIMLQKIEMLLSSQTSLISEYIQKIEASLATTAITQEQSLENIKKEDSPLHGYTKEELIYLINYINSIIKELLALQLQNEIAKKNLDNALSDLLKKNGLNEKIAFHESHKLCNNLIDIIVSHHKKGVLNEDYDQL